MVTVEPAAPEREARRRDPVVAFVGAIVEDAPDARGPAFNRAAQLFQHGLLSGLASAGLPTDTILSIELIPSFPASRRLFGRAATMTTAEGWTVRQLPFINVQPLKWLTTGLVVFAALVGWTRRHPGRTRVIHVLNLSMPPGLFVWLAARLTRSRALVSVLDVTVGGGIVPDTLFRRFDFALHRWLLPRFDGVMVIARAIAEDFLPGRPVCFIDGGIHPGRFPPPEPLRNSASPRPFRVILSGSLEPYNGVEVALEALTLLPGDFELVVAGNGSLTDKVREASRRDPRVVYAGFLDVDALVDVYRSADLLLNLRLTRAIDTRYFFPSKFMELLASGTPVLSTCTGHIEREYGPIVLLLHDESASGLAARLAEIAAMPRDDVRAIGRRARDFVMAEKTWAKQGERYARYIRAEVAG